jgi:hypothetical protein
MLYNPLNDFETPPRPMSPSEAGGQAFWLTEHPNTDPSTWFLLDAETRTAWIARVQPVTDAVTAAVGSGPRRRR